MRGVGLLRVNAAGEHLLRIINDILDLSKIEAGHLALEAEAFAPEAILEEVGAMMRDAANAKGLRISARNEGLPPVLLGDGGRLRQILLNFVSNAVKFSDRGEVTITGTVEEAREEGFECRFAVRDEGIGIREEDLARVFNTFEQVDGSTQRRFGGSGLGLSIARHLAHLMGGEVGAVSQPGEGSCFWLRVWLKPSSMEPSGAGALSGRQADVLSRAPARPLDSDSHSHEVRSAQPLMSAFESDDPQGFGTGLRKLRDSLRLGDVTAREDFRQIEGLLRTCDSEAARELKRLIGLFDFEAALVCVERLLESFAANR